MENIVIIGSGGHAKSVIDVVERQGKYRIVGLVDPIPRHVLGYPVVCDEAGLGGMVKELRIQGALIAIGDNSVRARVSETLEALCPTLQFATAIHPASSIGRNTVIGPGTVVMAGAVINACSRIGRHCIINTHACVDHDCELADCVSLGPGVVTGGECKIGPYVAIGLGANLTHRTKIGGDTVIGAGALVNKDITEFAVAYGVPAKVVRMRKHGERYL